MVKKFNSIFLFLFLFFKLSLLAQNGVELKALYDSTDYNSDLYHYLAKFNNGNLVTIDSIGSDNYIDGYLLMRISPSPNGNRIGLLFMNKDCKKYILRIVKKNADLIQTMNFENPIGNVFVSNEEDFCVTTGSWFATRSILFYKGINLVGKDSSGYGLHLNAKYSNSGKNLVVVSIGQIKNHARVDLFDSSGKLVSSNSELRDNGSFSFNNFEIEINEFSKTILLSSKIYHRKENEIEKYFEEKIISLCFDNLTLKLN